MWDPAVYHRYGRERSRPFFDLVARIRADRPREVVDLGCGSGELTATLAERWPEARVTGLDSSPEMIAAAAPGSPATWPGGGPDPRPTSWSPTPPCSGCPGTRS